MEVREWGPACASGRLMCPRSGPSDLVLFLFLSACALRESVTALGFSCFRKESLSGSDSLFTHVHIIFFSS